MSGRLFAVIPAAGESRRMGRPKLTMTLHGRAVIEHLLAALQSPRIEARVVVVRPDAGELADLARAWGADVVVPPSPPPEMRDSVECALAEIERRFQPNAGDGWLLVPADHPVLRPAAVVDRLIEAWVAGDARILVPTYQGRRGHPVFFRWELTSELRALPSDVGLNQLVRRHAADVREIAVEDESILIDLDTPADYERARRIWSENSDRNEYADGGTSSGRVDDSV